MKNIIKRRLFVGIFLTAVIMATIKDSVHAYNLLSFTIPMLFVIAMITLFSRSARRKSIETIKPKVNASSMHDVESWVWNLSIVFLLAAFRHWFLGMLWLISWLVFFEVRKDAMKEKDREKGGEL